MSKTKKLLAAALATVSLAAAPASSNALTGSVDNLPVACGANGSSGCA